MTSPRYKSYVQGKKFENATVPTTKYPRKNSRTHFAWTVLCLYSFHKADGERGPKLSEENTRLDVLLKLPQ